MFRSSGDVKAMVELALERGGIDVLVNNAGFSHLSGPPWQLEESEFERVFATNVKGVWLGVKHAVPHMIEAGGGVILNTASIGAVAPRPGVTVYNATKGAVMTMTRGLAVELARHRIRVNAMNPVAAETGFMRGALGVDKLPDTNREGPHSRHSLAPAHGASGRCRQCRVSRLRRGVVPDRRLPAHRRRTQHLLGRNTCDPRFRYWALAFGAWTSSAWPCRSCRATCRA